MLKTTIIRISFPPPRNPHNNNSPASETNAFIFFLRKKYSLGPKGGIFSNCVFLVGKFFKPQTQIWVTNVSGIIG